MYMYMYNVCTYMYTVYTCMMYLQAHHVCMCGHVVAICTVYVINLPGQVHFFATCIIHVHVHMHIFYMCVHVFLSQFQYV